MNLLARPTFWVYYLLVIVTALAGLLSTANLASAIGQPFGGFFAGHTHSYDQWTVEASTPPWWPALASKTLFYDDTLVAIDGHRFQNDSAKYFLAAQQAGRRQVTLTLVRDNQPATVQLDWQVFTVGDFIDLKLPDLINGLGFWVLAVTVFAARPQNPLNRAFAGAMLLTTGAIWLTISGLFVEAAGLTLWLSLVWACLASFVGISFIRLTSRFPSPMQRSFNLPIQIGYWIMAGVAIAYATTYGLIASGSGEPWVVELFTLCNLVVIGAFGLGALVYLSRLIYLFSRPNLSRRLRRQVAILLLGMAITLPYVVIIVLRSLIRSQQDYFVVGLDLRYLALATPLAFAFVILRYQTLQRINPMVAAVFMLASSALLASVVTWLMRLIEPRWMESLDISPFVPLFFVGLVTAAFYSLQNTLRGAFSKVFQWEFRSYRAVRSFNQQVIARPERTPLALTIAQALVEKLDLECAGVWIMEEDGQALKLEGQFGRWPSAPPPSLLAWPGGVLIPIRLDAEGAPAGLAEMAETHALAVAAPRAARGRLVGWLGSGKGWVEEILDDRTLEFIDLVRKRRPCLF